MMHSFNSIIYEWREKRSTDATGMHSCLKGEAFQKGTLDLKWNNNYNNRPFKSLTSSRYSPVKAVLWCFYKCILWRPDTRQPEWSHVHMLLPQSGPRADYRFWRVGQFEGLALHRGCFHDGMLKDQHARKGAQSLIQTVTWAPREKPNLNSPERGGWRGWLICS